MGLEQLDTIIAFSAVMLTLSLLVTIFVQMGIAVTNMRGQGLAWGVDRLLRQIDPRLDLGGFAKQLTNAVLRHPAVAHLGVSKAIAIRKEELVRVLDDLASRKEAGLDDEQRRRLAAAVQSMAPTAASEDLARSITLTNELLKVFPGADAAVKQAVGRALEGKRQIEAEIDKWFDTVMDRTTERFVLHTRVITAIVAAALVFGLHIDALAIFAQLSSNKDLRETIIQQSTPLLEEAKRIITETSEPYPLALEAIKLMQPDVKDQADKDKIQALVKEGKVKPATRADGLTWVKTNLPSYVDLYSRKMDEAAKTRLEQLSGQARSLSSSASLQLITWPPPPFTTKGVFGLIMSALLLGLGAPFWFNVLKQLSTLRPLIARKVDAPPAQR